MPGQNVKMPDKALVRRFGKDNGPICGELKNTMTKHVTKGEHEGTVKSIVTVTITDIAMVPTKSILIASKNNHRNIYSLITACFPLYPGS